MSSKLSVVRNIVLATALAAGVSGMARADDSSMNPFSGESYAGFNGGYLPKVGNPVYDNSPSAWRDSHPNGVSESQLQSLVTFAPMVYKPAPNFDAAPSAWRQSNPDGLSERELQAMSSSGPVWHQPDRSAASALASTNDATNRPSDSREPFGVRIARFFHVTPANQATPAN
jgi:hypothetical protein